MAARNNQTPLFLGGAPKCGTSSLFAALAAHPDIVGSEPKETFYFLDEGHPLLARPKNIHTAGPAAYRAYFPAREAARYQMDGSTHLLFQQRMPRILAETFPNARLLFILRDPIDRLRSSFAYTENNLGRFLMTTTFADFVDLALNQQLTQIEQRLAPGPSRYVLPKDLAYGRYDLYLAEWYKHFPPEQIKLIPYEAYREDAAGVIRSILDWLGVEEKQSMGETPRKNRTVQIRAKRLHRWAKSLADLVPAGAVKRHLKMGYLALQTASPAEYPLPEPLREQLRAHYLPTVSALRDTYGLETSWL